MSIAVVKMETGLTQGNHNQKMEETGKDPNQIIQTKQRNSRVCIGKLFRN